MLTRIHILVRVLILGMGGFGKFREVEVDALLAVAGWSNCSLVMSNTASPTFFSQQFIIDSFVIASTSSVVMSP